MTYQQAQGIRKRFAEDEPSHIPSRLVLIYFVMFCNYGNKILITLELHIRATSKGETQPGEKHNGVTQSTKKFRKHAYR
jgi:hypothetical protein